ncbi:AraC-type DNA-binding protein [Neorhodopirellula lusitana]|uniref:AraC-type DNA-binding protein n=1 Tax=Neorhodopirellula lusitana TaxID=445327 RepID=A0ABY1Q9C8_9BACT|nr:AraC family transcriptional regulator [Neorhodopirellula lusitana]SMP64086.1 AraC-type DNA-binding protein [Neorhodopirellula lusitana]
MQNLNQDESEPIQSGAEPDFVSDQVTEAKRYYLDLNPSPKDPLVVVCGGVERTRLDYEIDRQRFAYYGLEFVAEGQGDLTLGGEEYPLSSGSLFAYGPLTPHRIASRPPDRMRKYFVDIAGSEAKSLLEEAGLLDGKPLRAPRAHEMVELFDMLDREASGDADCASEICAQVLRLILTKIRLGCLAECPTMPRAYSTYERVREYLDVNFLTIHTIEEAAKQCDLTPIHLSRLFRRFGGMGAYQFLLRRKMDRAAELLLEENMLVKDVAEQLGFSDAFQFSRAFKRVHGLPPKQLVMSRKLSSVNGDD